VVTAEDLEAATVKAEGGFCDRFFKFGRRHGHWVRGRRPVDARRWRDVGFMC
jgi:hypothetical protein